MTSQDVIKLLTDAHNALEGMADSDIDHFEDEEEEAECAPVQFAARKVMDAIQILTSQSQEANP